MASATGIPEQNPAQQGRGEDEPLLGRAGDASQQDGKGIQFNFVLGTPQPRLLRCPSLTSSTGTAIIAQAGIWIVRPDPFLTRQAAANERPDQLTATIWASVFLHPLMLFSAHPVRRPSSIFSFSPQHLRLTLFNSSSTPPASS